MPDGLPNPRQRLSWSQQSMAKWQRLVDRVRTLWNLKVEYPLMLTRREGSMRISLADQPKRKVSSGTTVSPFRVLRVDLVGLEILLCIDDAATTDPANPVKVSVAKPYKLRESSYHNQTIDGVEYAGVSPQQRTARFVTGSVPIETQEITEKYVDKFATSTAGADIIVAARVSGLDVQDSSGEEVLWLDVSESRIWAEVTV